MNYFLTIWWSLLLIACFPLSGQSGIDSLIRVMKNAPNLEEKVRARLALNHTLLNNGKSKEAEAQIRIAVRESAAIREGELPVECLLDLCITLMYQKQFKEARDSAFSAADIASSRQDDKHYAYAMNLIGITYYFNGNQEKAKAFYRKGLLKKAVLEKEMPRFLIDLLVNYGELCTDPVERMQYFQEAEELDRRYRLQYYQLYPKLFMEYKNLGNFMRMDSIHAQMMRINHLELDSFKLAVTQMGYGEFLYEYGLPQEGLDYFNQAYAISLRAGQSYLEDELQSLRLFALLDLGRSEEAGRLLDSQLVKDFDPNYIHRLHTAKGRLLLSEGRTEEALARFQKALLSAESGSNPVEILRQTDWVAHTLLQMERNREAYSLLSGKIRQFPSAPIRERVTLLPKLAEALKRLHRFPEATIYFTEYVTLNDSLQIASQNLLKQFTIRNAESERALAEAQLQMKIIRERQQKTKQQMLFGVILIGLSGFATWALWKIRKQRSVSNALQALNQKDIAKLQSFNYMVAHDLKSPAIQAQILLQKISDKLPENTRQEAGTEMQKLQDKLRQIGALLDKLRVITKLQNSPVEKTSCSMRELVDDVLDELQPLLQSTGAQVEIGAMPTVYTDRLLLRQVWYNLLQNALKFSADAAPPLICIQAIPRHNQWEFSIADNGPGIPESMKTQIFEPFFTAHAKSAFDGDGLGLTITRQILELLGGKIWVADQTGTEGATFMFTLPER